MAEVRFSAGHYLLGVGWSRSDRSANGKVCSLGTASLGMGHLPEKNAERERLEWGKKNSLSYGATIDIKAEG